MVTRIVTIEMGRVNRNTRQLILEPIPGRETGAEVSPPDRLGPPPPEWVAEEARSARRYHPGDEGRVPPRLEICRACDGFVWPGEKACPHCGADLAAAAAVYAEEARQRGELIARLERLIEAGGSEHERASPIPQTS
jgi:hypothetical protein